MAKNLVMYSPTAIPSVHPPIPVKPCPFCGGCAIASSWIEKVEDWEVFAADVCCHDCTARIESNCKFVDDRDAMVLSVIEAWNIRV